MELEEDYSDYHDDYSESNGYYEIEQFKRADSIPQDNQGKTIFFPLDELINMKKIFYSREQMPTTSWIHTGQRNTLKSW